MTTVRIDNETLQGCSVSIRIDGVVRSIAVPEDRPTVIEITGGLVNLSTSLSVTASGDMAGNITAGGDVRCGNIEGNASAGRGVICHDVLGNAEAGRDVACYTAEGDIAAGRDVVHEGE